MGKLSDVRLKKLAADFHHGREAGRLVRIACSVYRAASIMEAACAWRAADITLARFAAAGLVKDARREARLAGQKLSAEEELKIRRAKAHRPRWR